MLSTDSHNSRYIQETLCTPLFPYPRAKYVGVSFYSASYTSREERVTLIFHQNQSSIFVIYFCDGNWWLACMLEIQEESRVNLTFCHPHGGIKVQLNAPFDLESTYQLLDL